MRVVSVLFCYAAPGLFFGAFAASGPAFLATSGLDTGAFGLLLALMTVGAIPAMTVLGNVIGRAPSLALPICLSAFAVACLLLGRAEGVFGLALGFLAASGALDVALDMRLSIVETETGQALFNRAHAIFPLAVLLAGPAVGAAFDGGVELRWVYGVRAMVMVLVALPEGHVGARTASRAPPALDTPDAVSLAPALLCLAALAASGTFMEMSATSWAAIFVESAFQTTATVSGFTVTAFMLGLRIGRLVAHFSDRRRPEIGIIRIGAIVLDSTGRRNAP